jgi:hypothetical protein
LSYTFKLTCTKNSSFIPDLLSEIADQLGGFVIIFLQEHTQKVDFPPAAQLTSRGKRAPGAEINPYMLIEEV